MTTLHTETYGVGETVVLLHGWAMHSGMWRPFAQRLARTYRVISVDFPGHGLSAKADGFTLPVVCERLAVQLPNQACHWLGWSLGGTVALAMAERFPERVASLTLLASNPRFLEQAGWPGIAAPVLDAFAANLAADCRATLLRFLSLQISGLPEFKTLFRQLKQALDECAVPDSCTLSDGLRLLQQADLRPVLAAIDKPVAVVLGGHDTLVPAAVGPALQSVNPELQLHLIERAGHVPFLTHSGQLLETLTGFWGQP